MRQGAVAVAIAALALLTYFQFPGHTWLQQDSQIYAPILEHQFDPLGADHIFDYRQADWSTKVWDVTRSQGVQVFLDSTGDLASWVFPLFGPFGRWIIYGVRRDQQNALPAEAIWSMIEKNISISGFNLERHLQDVPRALGDLFKSAIDGNLKVEIIKYPLADVSKVHSLLEQRKTTGKLLLIP